MDEPTNHMDIASMEAMEDTLLAFEGAVLLVTHDRYLLGRVADCLLRIHENKAEFREGGYEDNQAWVDLDLDLEIADQDEYKTPKMKTTKKNPEQEQRLETRLQAIDKEQQKWIKRLERKLTEAERKISELEAKISQLNEELGQLDPADWKMLQEKNQAIKQTEEDLMYAISDWEELLRALDQAKSQ
jgi:ATP-binding cassette subfamily F protein 3